MRLRIVSSLVALVFVLLVPIGCAHTNAGYFTAAPREKIEMPEPFDARTWVSYLTSYGDGGFTLDELDDSEPLTLVARSEAEDESGENGSAFDLFDQFFEGAASGRVTR